MAGELGTEALAAHTVAYSVGPLAFMARRDSAEHFSRLGALLFTAVDWIFILAYCFAIP